MVKKVEEVYKKLTDLKHVLLKPNMFVGSVEASDAPMWIVEESEDTVSIVNQTIEFTEAFLKIFDEVLVNAGDQYTQGRLKKGADKIADPCKTIKVEVDQETGWVSVWNDGRGVPVVWHKDENVWLPTMIFGMFRTSSNYDSKEERLWGGTNGYGAKLANAFSTEFYLETFDAEEGKVFRQTWKNNMDSMGEAVIKSKKGKKGYTKVSFRADFDRLHMPDGITNAVMGLLHRRTLDYSIKPGLKMWFNGEAAISNCFSDYVDLHYPDGADYHKFFDLENERWKVCCVFDPDNLLDTKAISFANGVCTYQGGKHVDHVMNAISTALMAKLKTKIKDGALTPAMVKSSLTLFVDALIVNPEFDSQSKTAVTTPATKFGSSYKPSKKLIDGLMKTDMVKVLQTKAQFNALAEVAKGTKNTRGTNRNGIHKKFCPAGDEKKRDGSCILVITEGDSAKASVVAGLNAQQRKKFGIFPVKGKLPNVREMSPKKILENDEISSIMKIVGLDVTKDPGNTKGLYYGKILVLTDQDVDGFHIKGLVLNLVHVFWPKLLKNVPGFVCSLPTPVVKVTFTAKNKEGLEFYTEDEYEAWKESHTGGGYSYKYYKGLGTSNKKEAQGWFTDWDSAIQNYVWDKDAECACPPDCYTPSINKKDICEDAILLAFGKEHADLRKDWLRSRPFVKPLDLSQQDQTIADYVNRELILFSWEDVLRSIPGFDGFKNSQRKCFFGGCKKALNSEVKVAILTADVSKITCYHHGEVSLTGTIIKMAQNYVGSNNLNLLQPRGQFGTRLMGGKDASASRYIFTQVEEIAKTIFNPVDNAILDYCQDDGTVIEPVHYLPTLPMILINGSDGIGTGFSTGIPCYNPLDVLANVRRVMDGGKPKAMTPWYRGFTGEICKVSPGSYECWGVYEIVGDNLVVTELPIGVWTQNYKEHLNKMIEASNATKGKKPDEITAAIHSYDDSDNTDTKVLFTIKFAKGFLANQVSTEEGDLKLAKKMKLVGNIHTSNMHMFNIDGQITKYNTPGKIISDFCEARIKGYTARKNYLLTKYQNEMDLFAWKLKFIRAVIADKIKPGKLSKAGLIQLLEEQGYPQLSSTCGGKEDYDYLLTIPIYKMTLDEVKKLKELLQAKQAEIDELQAKSECDLWEEDLALFEDAYDKHMAEWEESTSDDQKSKKKGKKSRK